MTDHDERVDREVTDRLAIRGLVDGYAHAVDHRDCAAFAALFTPDAVLSVYGPDGERRSLHTGREELASIPARLDRYERTLHLVSTHHCTFGIDRDNTAGAGALGAAVDSARGESYCEAHHISLVGPDREDLVMTISYGDRYARTPEGWRIQARDVRIEWIDTRLVAR